MKCDLEKNISYYNRSDLDLCSCEYCENYYRNIKNKFFKLESYFKSIGVDILKPFELVPIEYYGDKMIEYTDCMYIVFGECEDSFSTTIDKISLYKAKSHPDTGILEPHFVISFGPIILDWN